MTRHYFENRIGLVMYGGVSLAIYMNGIAQEFLNLVLSTATDEDGELVYKLKGEAGQRFLQGSSTVYRHMANAIEARTGIAPKFVVDILSGTSAGGLNGMFLAKALAEKKSIDPLTRLWIEEGEIERLLDREESYADLPPLPRRPSRSLLNSRRMYAKLLGALEQMDRAPLNLPEDIDLATELDLHMTATDLVGRPIPVNLGIEEFIPRISHSGGADPEARRFQLEKEHRAAFHFRFAPHERDAHEPQSRRNDFRPAVNPFLAFVGRCTSSIVPAFEPMRLKDALDVLDQFKHPQRTGDWKQFYGQFWRGAQFLSPSSEDDNGKVTSDAKEDFKLRPFGDGGYLDNKPFGHAFTSLKQRRALVPVKRMVFYVEPHPESNLEISNSLSVPKEAYSALRHAQLATSLGKAQNIHDRVREMRKLADQSERVRRAIESRQTEGPSTPPIDLYYESTLDQLASIVSDLLGFGDDDSLIPALRSLLAVSLRIVFEIEHGLADPKASCENPPAIDFHAFHAWAHRHYNLAYSNRIFEFIRSGIESRVLEVAKGSIDVEKSFTALDSESSYRAAMSAVDELYKEFWPSEASPKGPAKLLAEPSSGWDKRPEDSLAQMKVALDEIRLDPKSMETILAGLDPRQADILRSLLGLQISVAELCYVQIRPTDDRSTTQVPSSILRACHVLKEGIPGGEPSDNDFRRTRPAILMKLLGALRDLMSLPSREERYRLKFEELGDRNLTFEKFERHDAMMFPLLYQAGMADSYALDLVRISPVDARSLTKDASNPTAKLAGIGLGHFAAFLTRPGRILDIVWGRLDAAEVILRTYLPKAEAERLLPIAQLAIVSEALERIRSEPLKKDGIEPVPEESNERAIERLEAIAKIILPKLPEATL